MKKEKLQKQTPKAPAIKCYDCPAMSIKISDYRRETPVQDYCFERDIVLTENFIVNFSHNCKCHPKEDY